VEIDRKYRDAPAAPSEETRPATGLLVPADPISKPSRAFVVSVLLACLGSLIDSHWEIVGMDTSSQLLALGSSKLVLVALAYTSIAGPTSLRVWFVFVSGVSVLAVASALPSELAVSPPIFWLSLFECITKLAVVATYVNWQLLNLKRHFL
jgi:hypothetical protein